MHAHPLSHTHTLTLTLTYSLRMCDRDAESGVDSMWLVGDYYLFSSYRRHAVMFKVTCNDTSHAHAI